MQTLEIQNPESFLHHIETIPLHIRTLPSTIMIIVTSKFIWFFILNLFGVVGVSFNGWRMLDSSKHALNADDFERFSRQISETLHGNLNGHQQVFQPLEACPPRETKN
jgi:hypothetical protein